MALSGSSPIATRQRARALGGRAASHACRTALWASRLNVPSEALTTSATSGANLFSLHTAQVTVAYVPDVFGGVRRTIESADAQVDVAAFQREGTYLTLTSNIMLAAVQEASLRGQ